MKDIKSLLCVAVTKEGKGTDVFLKVLYKT